MPKIAGIYDWNGRPMYSHYNSVITPLKAIRWFVGTHYTDDPRSFHEKVCSSKQAAINWANSKKRIKEYGENVEFFIFHS